MCIVGIDFGECLNSELFPVYVALNFENTGKISLSYFFDGGESFMETPLIDFSFEEELYLIHHEGVLCFKLNHVFHVVEESKTNLFFTDGIVHIIDNLKCQVKAV